ncbi:MAG TPA: NAD-dependent epimerase/dehydratase family protein [Lysobacter sp.]
MSKNVLVIGGTRFFGKLLVARLLDAGHRVTLATRGRMPDAFGDRVRRIKVDRRNRPAMLAAFATAESYDVVYDQMCYSPLDAAISASVFAGRVKRYVMASTIEVYAHLYGKHDAPFAEDDLDLSAQPIDMDYPWHAPELAEESYGMGKRQAEAFFQRDGRLPVISVRIGHVLAGPEDFTGRLASYVAAVRAGKPLRYAKGSGKTSFIDSAGISDFLCWVGDNAFLGPINAASDGPMSALDVHSRVAATLELPFNAEPVSAPKRPTELSPFDYATPYVMDTARARSMGYQFSHSDRFLDGLICQHDAAIAKAA